MCADFLKHFHGDARVAANLIGIDSLDRQPSNASVTRRTRDNLRARAGRSRVGRKSLVD